MDERKQKRQKMKWLCWLVVIMCTDFEGIHSVDMQLYGYFILPMRLTIFVKIKSFEPFYSLNVLLRYYFILSVSCFIEILFHTVCVITFTHNISLAKLYPRIIRQNLASENRPQPYLLHNQHYL